MATAVVPGTGQFKAGMQSHSKYVALSPTCRSSQLLTPRDLTRITIDDRHYDQYQKCLRERIPNHIYSIPGGEMPSYGDRVAFYCQRDLPVKQLYSNTLLQRSRVRQTDELMPKPLSSNGVIDKEIDLPFPAEHPYYSHIKCFSMIPNTSPTYGINSTANVVNKDVCYPIFVREKASDGWSRIEDMHINSRIRHSTGPVWDLPRSRRHQRCYTYPAPKQIYLFGTGPQTGKELRSYTTQGLNRINRLVYYETSYQNHFPGYWLQSDDVNGGVQNVLVIDDSTDNDAVTKAETEQAHDNENVEETDSEEFAFHSKQEEENKEDKQEEDNKEYKQEEENREDQKNNESVATPNDKSESDQRITDKLNFMDRDLQDMLHLAETAKVPPSKPYVSTDNQYRFYRVDLVPDSQLPGSSQKKINLSYDAFRDKTADIQPPKQTPFTPRTAVASRRLMSAFEFNKSAVKRQFHAEYPENAPDLRENSRQGKRHLIHGHHAYYFH